MSYDENSNLQFEVKPEEAVAIAPSVQIDEASKVAIKIESKEDVARALVDGENVAVSIILLFYPAKRSHKLCYGRGWVGRNIHTKETILCSCVNNPLTIEREKYIRIKLTAIKAQQEFIKQQQIKLDGIIAATKVEESRTGETITVAAVEPTEILLEAMPHRDNLGTTEQVNEG